MPYFIYQEFLELHLRAYQLLLYVSEDARINHSLSPEEGDPVFLITDCRASPVGPGVDLLEIILIFFDFPLQPLNVLIIRISQRISLDLTVIIHTIPYSLYDGLELGLNS